MSLNLAITVAATVGAGPFPPSYAAGAYGFVAAGSNPGAATAGTCAPGAFFEGNILAICNEKQVAPQQLLVAIAGTRDSTFLSTVLYTDGVTSFDQATAAVFEVTSVNGNPVSVWIWNLPVGVGALTNGTIVLGNSRDQFLALTGAAISSTEIDLSWTKQVSQVPTNFLLYRGVSGAVPTLYQTLAGNVLSFNDTSLAANTPYAYYLQATLTDGTVVPATPTLTINTPVSGISATFNCNCEATPLPADGFTIDSLASLRRRMIIRCGYGAQVNNPPPGLVTTMNEYLRDAQNQLYRVHWEDRLVRMYAWQMVPNIRYYNLAQDESGCRRVDPLKIQWIGFEDLNQAWYPLIYGIDPVLYTRAQISTGWPTHVEIRSCIEIFPAPRAAYTLWIKGSFGLDPFAADTDNTTIDAEAVYLLACGLYKAAFSQPDAETVLTQASNWVKYLVASRHRSRRYVPRTRVQTPMTPPRFLPLES